MSTGRVGHTETLLPNGQVLVTGGLGPRGYLASTELYDPGIGAWYSAGNMANVRELHSATLLPTGHVLVAGGVGSGTPYYAATASAELYAP
jgi:hypothetical protein